MFATDYFEQKRQRLEKCFSNDLDILKGGIGSGVYVHNHGFEWKKNGRKHDLYHNGENTGLGAVRESDKKGVEDTYIGSPSFQARNNLQNNVKEGMVDLGIDGVKFIYSVDKNGFYEIIEDKTKVKIPFMHPSISLNEAKENAINYINEKLGIEKFKKIVKDYKK